MNFFESELRKLFSNQGILDHPTFVGRACYGDIGDQIRARIEFVDPQIVDHYSSISVSIINRQEGVVDRMQLRLEDILGIKEVPGNPNFPRGVSPYIWQNNGNADWYAFTPKEEDYRNIRDSVRCYVDVFRPLEKRTSIDSKIQDAASRRSLSQETAGARAQDKEHTL